MPLVPSEFRGSEPELVSIASASGPATYFETENGLQDQSISRAQGGVKVLVMDLVLVCLVGFSAWITMNPDDIHQTAPTISTMVTANSISAIRTGPWNRRPVPLMDKSQRRSLSRQAWNPDLNPKATWLYRPRDGTPTPMDRAAPMPIHKNSVPMLMDKDGVPIRMVDASTLRADLYSGSTSEALPKSTGEIYYMIPVTLGVAYLSYLLGLLLRPFGFRPVDPALKPEPYGTHPEPYGTVPELHGTSTTQPLDEHSRMAMLAMSPKPNGDLNYDELRRRIKRSQNPCVRFIEFLKDIGSNIRSFVGGIGKFIIGIFRPSARESNPAYEKPRLSCIALSWLCYLLPFLDCQRFGVFMYAAWPALREKVFGVFGGLIGQYNGIPGLGFMTFFLLSFASRSTSLSRYTRFNMRQAMYLDLLLVIPTILIAILETIVKPGGFLGRPVSRGLVSAVQQSNLNPAFLEFVFNIVFLWTMGCVVYTFFSNLFAMPPRHIPKVSKWAEATV